MNSPDSLSIDDELRDVPPADQVAAFITVVAEPVDILEIRTKPTASGNVHQVWGTPAELLEKLDTLQRWNRQQHHIYISANKRRDYSLSGDVNVSLARVLFADCDLKDGFTTIPDFLERIERAGLPEPSAVVSSGHGGWSFWRLATPMLNLAAWRSLQRRLSTTLQTDTSTCNPERMTRLPGFWNWKEPKAFAWLWSVNPTLKYSLDQIAVALPELPALAPGRPALPALSDPDELLKRARVYVAVPKGVGEGARNREIFRLAGHVASFVDEHGQCLSENEIAEIVSAFNDRCTPPLPEREFSAAVKSAIEHGKPRTLKPPRPPNHRQIALRGREVRYAH